MLDPRALFARFARAFDGDCWFDRAGQSRRDSSNRWRESAARAEISSRRMDARERDRDVAFEQGARNNTDRSDPDGFRIIGARL